MQIKELLYKGETYSLAEDGKVMRHSREGKKMRQCDNEWSYGKLDAKGVLLVGTERVHRLMALAFLGDAKNETDIVLHIDGDKTNNKLSNLKWVTKFESFILNPINQRKLVYLLGSEIETILSNFSLYRSDISATNYSWLAKISDEEANRGLDFLKANSKNKSEVIVKRTFNENSIPSDQYYKSLTAGVVQVNWKTPTEFLCCPSSNIDNPIKIYANNLKIGELFLRNIYGESVVEELVLTKNDTELLVITKDEKAVKAFAVAKIRFEDNHYRHWSYGTYFDLIGAQKCISELQGLEWTGGETFDDLCG